MRMKHLLSLLPRKFVACNNCMRIHHQKLKYKPRIFHCCSSIVPKTQINMNVLKKLETVAQNKPYYGFAKLTLGYHEVFNFRIVKNKFGKKNDKSILVELSDEIIFLPQHFSEKLNDQDLRELNTCIENGTKVYLNFGGRVGENG